MALYIPTYKRMKYSSSIVITRQLPSKGDIVVKVGEAVLPFTKLGRARVSERTLTLDSKIRISKNHQDDPFVFGGDVLGRVSLKPVRAPYSGTLLKKDGRYVFKQEEQDSWLLSGVWGTVSKVISNVAVDIKAQTMDINFIAYTGRSMMHELIVFPSPSHLLDLEYLERFEPNLKDKIVYVGDYLREPVVKKALELEVGALIGGSIDKRVFNWAKSKGLSLGITTGFGNLATSEPIYTFLKDVFSRHVFIDGELEILRIPVSKENDFAAKPLRSSLKLVKKGLAVSVFTKENFGESGVVEKVQGDIIYVRLDKSSAVVEVRLPNILAIA